MNPKKLIPFAVVLGILIIIALLSAPREKKQLAEEVQLEPIVPEDFHASDIEKVEMYVGSDEGTTQTEAAKVVLLKQNDEWVVKNKWNAPCDKKKVDDFLDKVKTLEGEFRSSSPDVLEDYALTDVKALNFVFYTSTALNAAPFTHIKVGKKERWANSFVRKADKTNVFTVDVNLRSEIGLWGDDLDRNPDSDHWLDKEIAALDKDTITQIALTTPDKHLILEKREKEVEEKEKEETGKEGEAKEEGKEAEEEKEKKKEYEWILAEGGPNDKFKTNSVDDILSALSSLQANNVADPNKKSEWGLDTPNFTCVVTLEDGKTISLLGAREKPLEDGYMMLEDKPDIVYTVAKYSFNRLFPLGNKLFDNLPQLNENQEDIRRITLTYPDITFEFTRGDKEEPWKVKKPKIDLELKKDKVSAVASTLADLQAIDYVDRGKESVTGLDTPSKTATFTLKSDDSHTITLGNDSMTERGTYARFDDDSRMYAISGTNMESIFPNKSLFFKLDLVDFERGNVKELEIAHKGNTIKIVQKEDDEYNVAWNGEEIDYKQDKIEEIIRNAAWLKAFDFLTDEGSIVPEDVAEYVALTSGEGDAVHIAFGKEKNNRITARKKGTPLTFLISKRDVERLQPQRSDIEKPPPPEDIEPPEETATTPTLIPFETPSEEEK